MADEQATIIDQQYTSGIALITYLKGQSEITLANEAESNFSKNILLSAASFFEKEISDTIVEFSKTHSNDDTLVISIIAAKAVKRQYHTYFDWEKGTNANSFFALFGEEFKNKMAKKVKDEAKLDESIKAFLQLGQERNKLVHQNFAEIILDKTAEEIYNLYKTSLLFISTIKSELITNLPEGNNVQKTTSTLQTPVSLILIAIIIGLIIYIVY